MSRKYEQKKRAERREDTRRKIVEAAVALHETVGPALTTITEIAERAGVSRLTVYRHFPDDIALISACSGLYGERNPFPDSESWLSTDDPCDRLRQALIESYAYHRRTEAMMSRALADVPDSPVMKPYNDYWRNAADLVASASGLRGSEYSLLRAAIGHALAFSTWRSLVRDQGLTDKQSVEVMVRLSSSQ
ncbi:MAG: TetR/AcrR family transcriptional regulator [Rhodothermia bacterium]